MSNTAEVDELILPPTPDPRDPGLVAIKRAMEQLQNFEVYWLPSFRPQGGYTILCGYNRHTYWAIQDQPGRLPPQRPAVVTLREPLSNNLFRQLATHNGNTPHKVGSYFETWVDENVFCDAIELAQAIDFPIAKVRHWLAIASLPRIVAEAFEDQEAIDMSWISELRRAIDLNESAMLDAAREIGMEFAPSPNEVFRRLMSSIETGGKLH
jgi:hypothetical protein